MDKTTDQYEPKKVAIPHTFISKTNHKVLETSFIMINGKQTLYSSLKTLKTERLIK
jgi:hypothetical protein